MLGRKTKDLWASEENQDYYYEKRRDDRYEVGYRKPPRNTQFKKGSSGNPSGRPRDSKSATTILRRALWSRSSRQ